MLHPLNCTCGICKAMYGYLRDQETYTLKYRIGSKEFTRQVIAKSHDEAERLLLTVLPFAKVTVSERD